MSNLKIAFNLFKLMESQWWTQEELNNLQNKKLRSIIKYAYHNIPIYHKKFKSAKILPDNIKTKSDLIKIPFLTKDEIQSSFPNEIVSPGIDINKCWTPRTSGSTGKPLTIVYNSNAESFEKASAIRPNLSVGQHLLDKWVIIGDPSHSKEKKKWFQKFGFFAPNYISLFESTEKQISMMEKIKPNILDGYSSSIFLIAKKIDNNKIKTLNPKIIYGTSEILTNDMREYINSVFNLEMFDQFGCVEMGRTAWECSEHTGYHMDAEAVIMEFLKNGENVSSGESGEIVYTNLYNYSMPLIRYKIGDVGIPTDKKCPCGRGLPMMKLIEGRKDAFIQLPNGKILPPIVWTILLRPFRLKQFKVIQEKKDKIKIQMVPEGNNSMNEFLKIVNDRILTFLGQNIPIEIEEKEEIPREPSGKVRTVISKVKIDW
jgi:phenylacetate-CoA ligase